MSYSCSFNGHFNSGDPATDEETLVVTITGFLNTLPGFSQGTINTSTLPQVVLGAHEPDVPAFVVTPDADAMTAETVDPLTGASVADLEAELAKRYADAPPIPAVPTSSTPIGDVPAA